MKSKLIVNIKKLMSILICATMISSTLPANLLNYVVFAEGRSITVSSYQDLQDAVKNAQDDDVIIVTQDITVPDGEANESPSSSCHCWLHCTKNITIRGSSSTTMIYFSPQALGFLEVTSGCTINMENITIDFGKDDNITRSTTLIQISDTSTLNLNSGATLQNAMVNNVSPIYSTNHSTININQSSSVLNLHSSVNGAIYLYNGSALNLSGTIQDCSAVNGGAIYASYSNVVQSDGIISNCYSKENGAAVYLAGNSTFTQNSGTITNCHANEISGSGGGAVYVGGASILTFKGTISNCTANNGGAIYSDWSTVIQDGGTISGCSAKENGGAIFCSTSTLQTKGTISDCHANTQYGVGGGAIYATSSENIAANELTISGCDATNGGAIHLSASKIAIENSNITNCSATTNGGAICATGSSQVSASTLAISGCNAANGGATHLEASTIQLTSNSEITNCSATQDGGAIHISGAGLSTLDSSTISNCNAGQDGGAIYSSGGGETAMTNSAITDCWSARNGGAVCNNPAASITIYSGAISGCYCTGQLHNPSEPLNKGNAIYNNWGANLYLANATNDLVSISLPNNAQAQDNCLDLIGYDGIYYEEISNVQKTVIYTVTLDANGGIISGETTPPTFDTIHIKSGQTLGDLLPNNLTKNGIPLSKWVDNDNNIITKDTPITKNVNLTAQYIPLTPLVELTSLTQTDNTPYTAGDWSTKNVNLVYNISSATSTINPDAYQISFDGGTTFTDIVASELLQINQLNASNLSLTILQDGEYNIIIKAFDAENRTGQSESVSIKIDKTHPDSVEITSPEYSNSATPTIYGTGEIGCTITLTDENNNIIGTAIVDENGEWEISEPISEGKHTISVVQTDNAGNSSNPTNQTLTVDTTNPTGTITIKNNSFNSFLNTITFGLLFNETTNITITTNDTPSGVKELKYLKTDQIYSNFLDDLQNANWQTADLSNANSISFNVAIPQEQLNDKFFIYAKITDNADNVTYIRSDGVIIYTDSEISTKEITYTKPKEENKDLSVSLNGNTIANVVNSTTNYTLQKNIDYTIEDSKIILKHEYLNQLSENTYTLEVSFTPAGETNLAENVTLPKNTVTLYVERSTQELSPNNANFNNLNSSYTYGDDPGIISLNGGSGTGAVTYKIADDPNNTNVATIDENTGKLTIVGAGVFKVQAIKEGDENYNPLTVESGVITVNKRPVTISGIVANSKPYDGYNDATFTITNAHIENLVNNDQLSISPGSASFSDQKAGNNKEVYFSNFSILDSSDNTPKNYVLQSQPAIGYANINPLAVTITGITANDKEYDAKTTTNVNMSNASITGKIPNDNLEISAGYANFADKNAGQTKTVTFTGFTLTGDDKDNYVLSSQPASVTANISKKTATINISIKDKVYDGTTDAEFTEGFPIIDGLISTDNVSLAISGTPIFANQNVENNKGVVLPNFNLTGDDTDNYKLTNQQTSVTANITPKPLTITEITANNKVYDGSPTATFNMSVEGKVNNEDVSVNVKSATFDNKNVGNNKVVTFSVFTLSGNDMANYTIPDETKSSTANITRKPLTISNVKIKDKPFDGTNNAEFDGNPTISGFEENDDVQLVNGTPIFSSTYIGQNISINFSPPFSLSGNDAPNYDISQPENITASIYAPSSSQINAPTLTKDNNEPYSAGSWSNKNVTASYTIESGSFPIDPTRTQISLNGTDFVNLTDVNSSQIQINQSNDSNVSFTILQDGQYQVKIKIFDTQNNTNTSNSVSIKIDKAKPNPVTIDNSEYSNSSTPTISGTGEPGCEITVTDENNNVIGTTTVDENGNWEIIQPIPEGEHTISVIQTDSAGNSSEPQSKTLVVDTTPPTGVIRIRNNEFNTFLNTITFGLLFKETTNISISASDNYVGESSSATGTDGYEPSVPVEQEVPITSGVKEIKYLKTDQVYSDITDIPTGANWQTSDLQEECYISFDVDFPPNQLNDKFFIYAKITDKADNVTCLRSDGIILYTDSAVTTTKITHFKPEEVDKELSVTLNGNTIASIIDTNNNYTLQKDTDYTIENNKIVLKHEYLNQLSEDTYTLEISFTPAGETNIAQNVTLPKNTFTLEIKKSNQELPSDDAKFNNLNSSYTYGDDPGIISLNGGNGTGAVTYEIVDDPNNTNVATIDENTGKLTIVGTGIFQIKATKAADDNYNSLTVTSNEITVNPRPVTISGIVVSSRLYNGDTSAEFDITGAQINNLVNNDQLSISPGSAAFADKNAENNKEVYFSNFSILDSSGNIPKNYILQSQPANASANITPKPVTIQNVSANDKIYNGNTVATINISIASISDKIPGDKLEISAGSANFADKNAGQGKTVTFTGFTLTGDDKNNYTLSAQPANVTANISAKTLNLDFSIKDKEYDGTTNAEFNGQVNIPLDDIIDGDKIWISNTNIPAFYDKNVGTNKPIFFPGFNLGGDDQNNYVLSQPENLTASISAKPLKVNGIVVNDKTYDGTTNATFSKSNMSIEGIINNEDISVNIESVSFDDKNVGTNKTVSFSGFTLSGSDKDNYTLSDHPENETANITPLPVTITNITANNKVYDGTVNATPNISQGSIQNAIPDDNLSIVAGSAMFANKNVGTNKVVTFSNFSLGGNDKDNYTLSNQPENATANISHKPLTVSNIKIKDKIPDGTRTAEFEGTPTLEGVADGDNVTLISGIPIFTSATEGQGIAVEFNPPFSLEGADASNYYIIQPDNIYGNIAYPSDSKQNNDSDNQNEDKAEETTSSEGETTPSNDESTIPEDETTPIDDEATTPEDETTQSEDDMEEAFEAEDSVTGIQVSAPKGVFPKWCRLIVREMYPNTTEYNDNYENLDEEKRNKIEHAKLYEIYIINQYGQIVQPDISKGLITVNVPVPNDYDLADLEIYRIKEDADDDFDESVVNINNRNYCQFETDHFSPYTMIDENSFNDLIQAILPYLLLFLILMFLILLIIILIKRKKK